MADENNTGSENTENKDALGNSGEKQPDTANAAPVTPVNAEQPSDNTSPTENTGSAEIAAAPVGTAPVHPEPQHSPVPQIQKASEFTLKVDGVVKGEKTYPAGTLLETAMKDFTNESASTFEYQEKNTGKKIVGSSHAKIESNMSLDVTKKACGG